MHHGGRDLHLWAPINNHLHVIRIDVGVIGVVHEDALLHARRAGVDDRVDGDLRHVFVAVKHGHVRGPARPGLHLLAWNFAEPARALDPKQT